MAQLDFYEVLGVSREAEQETIKKAYRQIAIRFHPDKNPGDKEAEARFRAAAEAYEVLGNAEKRARYDRFGHAGINGMNSGGFQDAGDIFSHFSDIFEDFFGGSGARQKQQQQRSGPQKGSDLRYVIELSLAEVIEGVEREIEFDCDQSCGSCDGTGSKEGRQPVVCNTCGGQGQVLRAQGFFTVQTTCPTCRGKGQMITDPCGKCRGTGREAVHRKIKVTIPSGVREGTQLRVANEGEGGYRGGSNGDLFVETRIQDDPNFERQGRHLYTRLNVTYIEALLGATVMAPTVTGQMPVEIPRGSAVGARLNLEGAGLPDLRSGQRGNLTYVLNIDVPSKLKKEEERLLREIAKLKGIEVSEPKSGFFGRRGK
jgi:molecular chaperone DnaJ